jgi:hypothetical protein
VLSRLPVVVLFTRAGSGWVSFCGLFVRVCVLSGQGEQLSDPLARLAASSRESERAPHLDEAELAIPPERLSYPPSAGARRPSAARTSAWLSSSRTGSFSIHKTKPWSHSTRTSIPSMLA